MKYKIDDYLLFQQEEEEAEVVHGQPRSATKEVQKIEPILPVTKINTNVTKKNETEAARSHLQSMVTRLNQSAKLIDSLPGFQKLAKELEDKADRLEHKGFTVALFGAFSAGKVFICQCSNGRKGTSGITKSNHCCD